MLSDDERPVSLFSHLKENDLRLIESACREIKVPKGGIILQQDERSFDFYIIRTGQVRISLLNEDGREIMLDILKEGAFFGELSFFDHLCRSATVTAVTDVTILILPTETFLKIIRENADIAISLMSVMANRLRKTNETVETLTFLDVAGRVSKLLIDLAKTGAEKMPGGSIKVQCPTHQTMATQIGASREAVTKAMKSLVERGLITVEGKEVIINPRQLEIL